MQTRSGPNEHQAMGGGQQPIVQIAANAAMSQDQRVAENDQEMQRIRALSYKKQKHGESRQGQNEASRRKSHSMFYSSGVPKPKDGRV